MRHDKAFNPTPLRGAAWSGCQDPAQFRRAPGGHPLSSQPPRSIVPASALLLLVLLSAGVAFLSQASVNTTSTTYGSLLKSLLLAGCIPQVALVGVILRFSSRSVAIAGIAVTLLSWLFVLELAVRVLTA